MFHHRAVLATALFVWLAVSPIGWALITGGGSGPTTGRNWPAGAETPANQPTRHSFWEGPPFGGGNYHFNYKGAATADFQATLDAFAAIDAPRLELMVFDEVTSQSAPMTEGRIDWEFEVWDREAFHRLNDSGEKITMSDSPWFGRPLPAPLLTLYLGPDNPVEWSAVHVPPNVTLLDRRVATSPYADSTGGVVRATIRDMATGEPLPGAQLEIGSYEDRDFKTRATATAGDDGVAVARDLPAGSYVVYTGAGGHASRHVGHYRNYGRTLGVFDDVQLASAGALRGRVIDAAGKPLAGVTVGLMGLVGLDGTGYEQNLFNEKSKVLTDADGRFVLEPLPQGRACLSIRKPGYHYFSFDVHPIPGPEVSIAMAASGSIRGRVTGIEGLSEGQQVHIALAPMGDPIGRWSGEIPCENDGSFSFEGIPTDTYTLTPFVATRSGVGSYTIDRPVEDFISKTFIFERGRQQEIEIPFKRMP